MPLYPKAKKPDPVANGLELKTGEVGEINALKDVFVYAFLHSNLSLSLSPQIIGLNHLTISIITFSLSKVNDFFFWFILFNSITVLH